MEYKIYSYKGLLGTAGFTYFNDKNNIYPRIYINLSTEYKNKDLESNILEALIEQAFTINKCNKIYVAPSSDSMCDSMLKDRGFIASSSSKGACYELNKQDNALYSLSKIIIEEGTKLVSDNDDMTIKNIERTRYLWFKYFYAGIPLSTGGVSDSFINPSDVLMKNNTNLQSFNFYRSDLPSSTVISQYSILQFLRQELSLDPKLDYNNLYSCFCLGAHEGAIRLLRCLYDQKHNKEVFFATNGYSFSVAGASTMKPLAYKVHLVPTSLPGEKMSLQDLTEMQKKHPSCKTLFLELKTTAASVYTTEELQSIINFCKQHNIYLIGDAAHLNMQLDEKYPLADLIGLSTKEKFYDYALIITGSKTYGMERARIGYVILDARSTFVENLKGIFEKELFRLNGSLGDLHVEAMNLLMKSSLRERQVYIKRKQIEHKFNMNLMLAYLEGIHSEKIDANLREQVKAEIPPKYQHGIDGMHAVHKPEAGIHVKVNIEALKNKYFFNIRTLNSEIFSYVLNKVAGITTLHSYQILDPNGYSLRLSFCIKEDVHKGMQAMHDFVKNLKDYPIENKFLPGAGEHVEEENNKPKVTKPRLK